MEDAAKREAQEETSLDVDLINILGVYSDPKRDPRGHNMSTVFIGRCFHNISNEIKAVAKDDAAEIEWMSIDAVGIRTWASTIKKYYRITRNGKILAGHFGHLNKAKKPAAAVFYYIQQDFRT